MAAQPARRAHRERLRSHFPDLDSLSTALAAALPRGEAPVGEVVVVDRRPHAYASSFPSEVVRCQLGDGTALVMLCKYGIEQPHDANGHRGGVAYEADVYRYVLAPLSLTAPAFLGSTVDPQSCETWLFLGFLDGVRPDDADEPDEALRRVAGWIARFHAANAERLGREPMPFLNTYDASYYSAWAQRTVECATATGIDLPWLPRLRDGFEELVPALLEQPTVIHGEFTPHNNLVRDGEVYPIDWESAAIAAGEIDLASLTDRWPHHVVRACEDAYLDTRWPAGPPAGFGRTLDVARLYWQFRWLGKPWKFKGRKPALWRVEQLHAAGRRLGVL